MDAEEECVLPCAFSPGAYVEVVGHVVFGDGYEGKTLLRCIGVLDTCRVVGVFDGKSPSNVVDNDAVGRPAGTIIPVNYSYCLVLSHGWSSLGRKPVWEAWCWEAWQRECNCKLVASSN